MDRHLRIRLRPRAQTLSAWILRAALGACAAAFAFVPVGAADDVQKIKIGLDNRIYRGESLLYLRQMLRERGYDVCAMRLVRVRLIAKAPNNRNRASLIVGDYVGEPKTIPGEARGWHKSDDVAWPWAASRKISFWNTKGDAYGVWRLRLHGTLKIHAVEIFYRPGRSCR